ncbi:MAG: sulfite exporter TauE/SafE family protein, partial [Alistipes sp.]|nr:sulfite exporter TauE/SafE family protein [Alistipes sp.]
ILAIALWLMRMDLIMANAIKGFVILVATPFSLAVFMIMGNVDYTFGIIHGIGNMIGSFLASHYMADWGKGFIKIFMAIIVAICFADLVGVISLHDIFYSMLSLKE